MKPEILNSDQGSQYTCSEWIEAIKGYGITISMDGRNRCLDNVWIEGFWRTLKQEYFYLNPTVKGQDMSCAFMRWLRDGAVIRGRGVQRLEDISKNIE